jgi:hypothetical protein
MKRLFGLIIFILSHQFSFAQIESKADPVFKIGEVLKYRLRYGFITAAEAVLKVEDTDIKPNNRPVYNLIAQGKTSGTFDIFYKVRNRYDSYIDKETLLPHLYTENIHESNYRRKDKAHFYQREKKVVANKGTFKGNTEQIFDVVSAYYFSRNLDMTDIKPGKAIKMHYFLDDEVSSLEIVYIGKEKVKTSMGSFNCLKFSPSIQPGRIFKKDSKLFLWITDDGNRIPVKAQVDILVGSVSMEITSASNLKYPLVKD